MGPGVAFEGGPVLVPAGTPFSDPLLTLYVCSLLVVLELLVVLGTLTLSLGCGAV